MNGLELGYVPAESLQEGLGLLVTENAAVLLRMNTVSPQYGQEGEIIGGSCALLGTVWGKQQAFSWCVLSFYSYTGKCYKKT